MLLTTKIFLELLGLSTIYLNHSICVQFILLQSGKTTLANILSDSTENIGTEYRPTQGVRIIEFETQFVNNKKGLKAEIELWDCSGDLK